MESKSYGIMLIFQHLTLGLMNGLESFCGLRNLDYFNLQLNIIYCIKLIFTQFLTGIKHFGQATPLLLTVAVIELSDIAFAVRCCCPYLHKTFIFFEFPLSVQLE